MKIIYNKRTGFITQFLADALDTSDLDLDTYAILQSSAPIGNYYVDVATQTLRDIPERPSIRHIFNYETKSYDIDHDGVERDARNQRNELLALVDRVNPVWYNSLTKQQRTELQNFRAHLLAVPQQPQFPLDITWPSIPEWLQ